VRINLRVLITNVSIDVSVKQDGDSYRERYVYENGALIDGAH